MNETNHNFPWQLERGTARIFEPQQQAEILSWFGRDEIPRQQKEDFLQALIHFEDGCGGFYNYRAHFLAAEALARFRDSQFGDEIVAQLLRWSYAYFQPYPHWQKFPLPLVLSAQKVLERTDRQRVISAFVEQLRAVEYRWVLCGIAKCLGKFEPGNSTAIAALVGLIEIERKPEIVLAAARGLIQTDVQHSIVIPTLIALAEKDNVPVELRPEILELLGKVGSGNEEVIQTLLRESAKSPVEKYYNDGRFTTNNFLLNYRNKAFQGLSQIAVGNRVAIDALLQFITDMPESTAVCGGIGALEALETIEKIAIVDENAIITLTQFIQFPHRPSYLCDLAKTLLAIDSENEKAVSILASLLIPPASEKFLSDYERLYSFRASYTSCCAAAAALARVETYRETAISTLQELASTFQYGYLVAPALTALASLDPTKELAIETVLKAIENPVKLIGNGSNIEFDLNLKKMSEWVAESNNILLRQKAIATLGAFIEQTKSCQESSEPKEQIKAAALALGKIAPNHPLALSILLPTFEAEKDIEREDETEDYIESKYRRFWIHFEDLAEIGALDRVSVAQVLEIFQLDEFEDEKQGYLMHIAEIFERHIEQISESSLAQWVQSLKPYLGETYYRHPYSGYEACYKIIWNCAQVMSYPVFYNAWH